MSRVNLKMILIDCKIDLIDDNAGICGPSAYVSIFLPFSSFPIQIKFLLSSGPTRILFLWARGGGSMGPGMLATVKN